MKFKSSIVISTCLVLQSICAQDFSALKDPALFSEFMQLYGKTMSAKFATKADSPEPYFIGSISSQAQSFNTGFISSNGTTAYIPTINDVNKSLSLYPWISVFDISNPGSITFKGTCAVAGINDNSALGVWINTKDNVGILPVINGAMPLVF